MTNAPGELAIDFDMLAAMVEGFAADYAVAARLGRGVPTIDLHVDYHRPAFPGALVARASAVKLGGTVGVAEARILDEKGTLVASGRALFLTRAPDGEKEAKA